MSHESENPFADYGGIVSGTRFIGRKNSLHVITDRVISPAEPGNLALIGMPAIGKSSLAYQATIADKAKLHARKMLPLWITVGTYENPVAFFSSLVTHCRDELESMGELTAYMTQAATRALQAELPWGERYERIQRFFSRVRQSGTRVLFVLDDFDAAAALFQDDPSAFRKLRELSYQPEWRVTFLTTSCRTLREIELQAGAEPSLAATFREHYVAMFNAENVQEYFARIAAAGVPVTTTLKESIAYYCGRHPYLLEMLGYEIVELFHEKQQDDVDSAAHAVDQALQTCMMTITELLRQEGLLQPLLQLLFKDSLFEPLAYQLSEASHASAVVGKQVARNRKVDATVKHDDIDALGRYGYIQETAPGSYVAFSARYQTFLRSLEREASTEVVRRETVKLPETEVIKTATAAREEPPDLWATWRKTEKLLRSSLNTMLQNFYGENWVEQLERADPMLFLDESNKNLFQRCREFQRKEAQIWGSRASRNLLDFTSPQELFALVFSQWHLFQPVFGKDVPYWRQRSDLLAKIRAPLAHNREEVISDEERQAAEEYCKEILAVLSAIDGGSHAQTY
jgi:hypothetical protein